MARRLRGLFVAAVLLAALLPAAQGQDWAEMAYYQVIMQAGNTVYAYAYTGLAYPEPYLPCPLPYYIFEDCWDQYSTHAEADLYRDGWWVTGSQDWQFNGEAYAWVWAPAEGGWWSLASWHELDVQWEDWFDWWSWVTRYDYVYDYLLGYLQVSDPPPVVSSLVPSAALRGESGQVTIYGEHFGQSPWVEVGGTGVTMQVTSVGQGWIQAQYWVESNAESGDHAVTVRTASGTSNPAAFTVQDPTPVVSWIDPDIWEAGWSNVPVTIYGSGFGDNPVVNAGSWAAVSVQWANGVEIHGTVSVDPNAPDTMETVTVTSRGWGGQGFMPAPGASPTANATVQIRGAGPPGCGDSRKDALIAEYIAYGLSWVPTCGEVIPPIGSFHFSAQEINQDNDYRDYWTITKDAMLDGLEGIRADSGGLPMPVSSGYRNPASQMRINPSSPNSRHTRGDAVDIRETDPGRRELFKWTLGPAHGACVEPLSLTPTWVHFDWRPGNCPVGW